MSRLRLFWVGGGLVTEQRCKIAIWCSAGTNCDNLYHFANKQLQLPYWLKIRAKEGQHQTCCMSSYVDLKLPPVISGVFSMVDLPATKSGKHDLFFSSNWKWQQLMPYTLLSIWLVQSLEISGQIWNWQYVALKSASNSWTRNQLSTSKLCEKQSLIAQAPLPLHHMLPAAYMHGGNHQKLAVSHGWAVTSDSHVPGWHPVVYMCSCAAEG
jgi:hypothetical protein